MTDDSDDFTTQAKLPTQARSVATFAGILRAASELICSEGIQALNTNAVAQRAGVNIGTLYHYFPDKGAILLELFRASQERRSSSLLVALNELPTSRDLATWCHELFEGLDRQRRADPTQLPLRRSYLSVPDLVAVDAFDAAETATFLASLLQQRFASLGKIEALAGAKVIVVTVNAFVDSAFDDEALRDEVIHQYATLLHGYLSELKPPPGIESPRRHT
jgi:AcrR family transcriptional regulator